jgi:hypothetical protein
MTTHRPAARVERAATPVCVALSQDGCGASTLKERHREEAGSMACKSVPVSLPQVWVEWELAGQPMPGVRKVSDDMTRFDWQTLAIALPFLVALIMWPH